MQTYADKPIKKLLPGSIKGALVPPGIPHPAQRHAATAKWLRLSVQAGQVTIGGRLL